VVGLLVHSSARLEFGPANRIITQVEHSSFKVSQHSTRRTLLDRLPINARFSFEVAKGALPALSRTCRCATLELRAVCCWWTRPQWNEYMPAKSTRASCNMQHYFRSRAWSTLGHQCQHLVGTILLRLRPLSARDICVLKLLYYFLGVMTCTTLANTSSHIESVSEGTLTNDADVLGLTRHHR
jgi:hypothetical protein